MNRETVLALNQINRTFYRAAATRFSATRQTAWPGSLRLVRRVEAELPECGATPRLLDVGCGNGRFADALLDGLEGPFLYLGIDGSPELVAEARTRHRAQAAFRFVVHDFVVRGLASLLGAERFPAIFLIGVLHHVPGHQTRARLLTDLAQRLTPGGLLGLSIWRFARFERFRERFVPWERYLARSRAQIELGELEPGDHLLPFGAGEETLRYCHALDDVEARALLGSLGLEQLESFEADGETENLNRYLLLRRPLA